MGETDAEGVFERGGLCLRRAQGAADLEAVLGLRSLRFRGGLGSDLDDYDAQAAQYLIEESASGALLAAFRLRLFPPAQGLGGAYAARFYDLSRLGAFPAPMLELGRFCTALGQRDPEVLRLAWAGITAQVDRLGVGLLFGCSSFSGVAPDAHAGSFAHLRAGHLCPDRWAPQQRAPEVISLRGMSAAIPEPSALPPLLRSYLMLGGWVSDHAVIDRDLGTIHVFTGVEIAAIPPARARALRLLASG